ncbi:hypothetical protein MXB_1429, partial [Myxobolus squamalis]
SNDKDSHFNENIQNPISWMLYRNMSISQLKNSSPNLRIFNRFKVDFHTNLMSIIIKCKAIDFLSCGVSALAYCGYNILMLYNLSLLDSATFFSLIQCRIIFTALIYKIYFYSLNPSINWINIVFLTALCVSFYVDIGSLRLDIG